MRKFFLFFLLTSLTFYNFHAYSQCTINVEKTDISCFGQKGSATVTVTGGTSGVNNCGTPMTSNENCTSDCYATINSNAAATADLGQKICVVANDYNGSITLNSGGKVVLCGTNAAPSSITFNGGTLVINGSITFSGTMNLWNASSKLINFGTIIIPNGLNGEFEIENHGTINVSSGDFIVGWGGKLSNTGIITVNSGQLDVRKNSSNSGTINVTSNQFFIRSGVTFTNNCTINSASFLNEGDLTNRGRITVNGNFDHKTGSLTTEAGTEITANSFSMWAPISGTGSSCSSIKINTITNIYWGGSLSGQVRLCDLNGVIEINQPNINTNIDFTNCTCNVSAPVCTYTWKNSSNVVIGNQDNISNLDPGTYTVEATCPGCSTLTESVTFTEPPELVVNYTKEDIKCYGDTERGSITLTVSGGTPGYTFDWGNGITSQNRTDLPAGSYSVTVTDSKECTKIINDIIINEPSSPLTGTIVSQNVTCFGENDGSVNLTVNGGTPPYSYNWNNGSTEQDLADLPPGTYSVVVSDFNNCTLPLSVTITEPSEIEITVTHTDVSSFGLADGTATVSVNYSGGIGNPIASNCATPGSSPENCEPANCTSLINSDSGPLTVGPGEKVCLTATSFTSSINMNGGVLIICGNASPQNLNYNLGGTIFINGSLTINGTFTIGADLTVNNYGTLNCGTLDIVEELNNHGTITVSSGNVHANAATAILNNYNSISINAGNFINTTAYVVNSGTLTVSNDLQNNGASTFINNCTISVGQSFINNGTFNNNGGITVTSTHTVNGGSILNLGPGSQIQTNDFNLMGAVHGLGGSCSSIKVANNITVNGGSVVDGMVSICPGAGTLTNNEPSIGTFLNCDCELSSSACSVLWSTGATDPSIENLPAGNYSVTVTCNGCSVTRDFKIKQNASITINTVNVNEGTFVINAPGITAITENSGEPTSEITIDPTLPDPGLENEVILVIDQGEENKALEIKLTYNDQSVITSVKAKFGTDYLDINQDYYEIKNNNKIYLYNEKPSNVFAIATNLINGVKLDQGTKQFEVTIPANTIFSQALLSIYKINEPSPVLINAPSSILNWDGTTASPGVYEFWLELTADGVSKTYKGQFIVE